MGYAAQVAALAQPLSHPDDLEPLVDAIGSARVVLLGEASHGTYEFYAWRAALTRRLISGGGFSFVAVEGDWPDCRRIDASVRGLPGAPSDPRAALGALTRWPTWMWANEEVADFCRWLARFNARRPLVERVGFHGLDLYSLWPSLADVESGLQGPAQEHARAARRCFEPFVGDQYRYVLSAKQGQTCRGEIGALLAATSDKGFHLRQSAHVVVAAEEYYRAMGSSGSESWNVRDRHMADTLDRLLARVGPSGRAVIWAHNTHLGDARATNMVDRGEINLGQLVREREPGSFIVGFAGGEGTVVASDAWAGPTRVIDVPPGQRGSFEHLFHVAAPPRSMMVFSRQRPAFLDRRAGHRAIGVVYDPRAEHLGNYVPTVMGDRYDALLWFDRTRALTPLGTDLDTRELETYPFGV